MRRVLRWLLGVLLVLVVLAVAGLLGLKYYLTSPQVAGQAGEQLTGVLGMPVRVRSADIGLAGSSSLRGVELFGSEESEQPWAEVEEVEADVGAVGLARGESAPRHLTLRGANVELRFAADGTLLTKLPSFGKSDSPSPNVRIVGGRLTLRQEGREPMVLDGIDVGVEPDANGGLGLAGTVSDPQWGQWKLDGSFASGRVHLHLTTPGATVTQARLRTVPFVPPETWKQVRVEGNTAADVTLRFGTDGKDAHYRVALDVARAGVDVTSIMLHADDAAGNVVIEDGLVKLRGVTGRVADGALTLPEADLNFRDVASRMTFVFSARDLNPRKLPEAWRSDARLDELLRTFDGDLRIRGSARLTVTVAPDGAVRTSGGGEAELLGAKLAGKDAKITLRIDLSDGFRVSGLPPALPVLATLFLHARQEPKKLSSYAEVNLEVEDVDVPALLKELGLTLPLRVAGRLSFRVRAGIPLVTPRDLKTYRLEGTATLPTLDLQGLALRGVEAKFHYAEGVLHLDRLDGRVPDPARPDDRRRDGRIGGTARWGLLEADGRLTADVKLESAPVAALRPFLPGPTETFGGTVSGSLAGGTPSAKITDPTAWDVTGRLHSDEVRMYGWAATKVDTELKAEKGIARLTDVRGEIEGAAVTGSGELRLADPFDYKATLQLGETDLAALARLSRELRPPMSVRGKLNGTATAEGKLGGAATLSGTARGRDLVVGNFAVGEASGKWALGDGVLKVTDLKAALYGGSLAGTATVPLDGAKAGAVDLDFTDLDAGALAKAVPELPLAVAGKASGKLVLGIPPPPAADMPRDLAADLTLTEGRIRIQNIPTRRLRGTVKLRGGATEYDLEGEALGGRFRLDGQVPARQEKQAPKKERQSGRLRVERARLSRLAGELNLPALAPLSGRFDLDLPFAADEDGELGGRGRFLFADVRYGDESVAEEMRGDVVLRDGTLDFRDVTGRLAGGLARVRVRYDLRRPGRSFFTLSAERVEAARLLQPWQGRDEYVRGPADVSLRGRLGSEWNGGGEVTLHSGRVFGVAVTSWRIPVDFRFVPAHGRGELTVSDSHAQVGRGRATGRATFRWGGANRLEGTVRFNGVEVREVVGGDGESSYFGEGRATGRFDFGAADLRTVNDLTGNLEASMSGTQALRMPVLRELVRFVAPGQSGARFESGDVRARLANGVFRVQRLGLSGSFAQLVLEGTVTLTGRLDMEATVRTGNVGGVSPAALRLLGLRIPALGPIPIGLILEVSTALSNRVVHLRITGTVRSPVVRVEPVRLLTEEAIRYFLLRQLIPIP